MYEPALHHGLVPSLLDRLIDPESVGTVDQPGYSLPQAMHAMDRDIEDLLNTHSPYAAIPAAYVELQKSPLTYGIPDVRQVDVAVADDRQRVAHLLAGVLERFEPRLRDVRVTMAEQSAQSPYRIDFRIEARLVFEPAPPVRFDGFLELKTGQSTVYPGEVQA
jgi:type VI secretion system protein ImpF